MIDVLGISITEKISRFEYSMKTDEKTKVWNGKKIITILLSYQWCW
jgi:hypothetical protein